MTSAHSIHADQDALTPEQQAEVERFRTERIRAYLSTEPVDESVAEDLLAQAYATARLAPPAHIHWVDGPLELVAVLARRSDAIHIEERFVERLSHCIWDDAKLDHAEIDRMEGTAVRGLTTAIDYRIRRLPGHKLGGIGVFGGLNVGDRIAHLVWDRMAYRVWEAIRQNVGEHLAGARRRRRLADSLQDPRPWVGHRGQ